MKIEIILDGFNVPFPDIVDKEKYEVVATSKEGTWVVQKKAEHEKMQG